MLEHREANNTNGQRRCAVRLSAHEVTASFGDPSRREEDARLLGLGKLLGKQASKALNGTMNEEARISGFHRVGKSAFLVVDVVAPKRQRYRDGVGHVGRDRGSYRIVLFACCGTQGWGRCHRQWHRCGRRHCHSGGGILVTMRG